MADIYAEFLEDFFADIRGIGAKRIALIRSLSFTNSFEKFMRADNDKLELLKTGNNRRVLDDQQIDAILKKRNLLKSDEPVNEALMRIKILNFLHQGVKNINELTVDELVAEGAINPFLAKALGIRDFESLARFYVYQRVGRSLVTSFGTTIEDLVRILARGQKGKWWDVEKNIGGTPYFMSVKSGPRDMDKDQVEHFAQKAKEILKRDPSAVPVIAMGYGKIPWQIISKTLEAEGLDPKKHMLIGKELYERITGRPDYYKKLLIITNQAAIQAPAGKKAIDIIEDKVKEVARDFKKKYKTVNDILLDTF